MLCTSRDHVYPAPKRGQVVRRCQCGAKTLKVNRNLDQPFYTAGENIMAKKNIVVTSKKSVKKSAKAAPKTERVSNLEYRWVRPMKDEPNAETTYGTIYQTMRKVKKGSLAEITDAAVKNGLTNYSDQDPTRMARIHLRLMVNDGAVTQSRNGEAVAVKSSKKVKAAKNGKKSFKLVKKG
jgi:hypothetical protein